MYLVPGGVPGPQGLHLVPGGVPGLGGVCSRGCTWSQGDLVLGEPGPGRCTWSQGDEPDPGVHLGGCLLSGVYLVRGVSGTPPSVNRMTNRCKNITLPQTSFAGGNDKILGVTQLNDENWTFFEIDFLISVVNLLN